MLFEKDDDILRMRWALVCSVPKDANLTQLSEFSTWFVEQVTRVAAKMNIYARFEELPKTVLHAAVGSYEACASAYESIRKVYRMPLVIIQRSMAVPEPSLVRKISVPVFKPKLQNLKSAPEYRWMRTLSNVHGFVRQGILLENALDRFAGICKPGDSLEEVFENVAQWVARACNKLCLDKDPLCKPYELCVGPGDSAPLNKKIDQDAMQVAVNIVTSQIHDIPPLHREESAVNVAGYPSTLNEFGVAQLFHGLKVTGVALNRASAVVTFATKFLAYQACSLNGKKLDRVHTLHVKPISQEVQEQLELAETVQ